MSAPAASTTPVVSTLPSSDVKSSSENSAASAPGATNENAATATSASAASFAPSSAASSSTSSSSSSSSSSAPPKQWKVADVPEGADPLDYINMEKLKHDNRNMPTTKEGINEMLNTMPLTADVIPDQKDMNRDFMGIQSIIDETPHDTRAENFKDSGNEAYKLSVRMKKEHKEGVEKFEKLAAERKALGAAAPVLTDKEKSDEKYDYDHIMKLESSAKKRLIDAVTYYTQALDVEKELKSDDPSKPAPTLSRHLKVQILTNRALVHIAMENFGRAQADCDDALKLDPKHAKAAHRGGTAALSVNPPKIEKARSYLTAGRQVDPARAKKDWQFRAEQKSMDELEAKIVALETKEKEKQDAIKAKEAAAVASKNAYAESLNQALQSRGLKVGPLIFDFARSAYAEQSKEGKGMLPRAMLYPPPPAKYTSSTTIGWPLLFLYPEVLQSDFIQECKEDSILYDQLAQMFPPQTDFAPWDEKKKYSMENISVWIDSRGPNIPADSTPAQDQQARMLVNPKQSLRAILSNPKLLKKNYVVPGIPTFIVLPKQ